MSDTALRSQETTSGRSAHTRTTERVAAETYQSTVGDYLIYMFHVATYEFARQYVGGKRVLDFGCGTGYGTQLVARSCRHIVGVDISQHAIDYAESTYRAPNLEFERIARIQDAPLRFPEAAFEAVLSFQVIEHLDAVDLYLSEIARVLAPGGVFICVTPDRTTRLFSWQRPWNLYHLYEYAPEELKRVLQTRFPEVTLLGMTAAENILGIELRRSRRARLTTLPFTFPHAPERWRRGGLQLLKCVYDLRAKARDAAVPEGYAFDHAAVRIEPEARPSTNIVAVARKPGA